MDHNPFIARNNDLFIMLIAGMAVQFASQYVFPLSLQQQFVIVLSFSFLSGLFLSSLFQSLEWALFFAMGVLLVTTTPFAIQYGLQETPDTLQILTQIILSSHQAFFLLSSWLVGIPVGYFFTRVLIGNYYRRGLF